jgi:hypothetical protein
MGEYKLAGKKILYASISTDITKTVYEEFCLLDYGSCNVRHSSMAQVP